MNILWNATASVTILDDFWNFLAKKLITKVAQMFCDLLGSCENHRFLR